MIYYEVIFFHEEINKKKIIKTTEKIKKFVKIIRILARMRGIKATKKKHFTFQMNMPYTLTWKKMNWNRYYNSY